MHPSPAEFRLCIHGPTVTLRSHIPALLKPLERWVGDLVVPTLPDGFSPISGELLPYDTDAVVRHLPASARLVARLGQLAEVYQDDHRLWLIDDLWGLCEIDLLKRSWRSWILPDPAADAVECVENAVLWPLAQLLRPSHLTLLPAASVAFDGSGILLLGSFSLEPELKALRDEEFDLIAQRWSALRCEDGAVSLLSMPGLTRTVPPPRPRNHAQWRTHRWRDLGDTFAGQACHQAPARSILLIEPGRRAAASAAAVPAQTALTALRSRWPILELPHGRHLLATALAATTVLWQVQLSRHAGESARLIRSLVDPRSVRRLDGSALRASVRLPAPPVRVAPSADAARVAS